MISFTKNRYEYNRFFEISPAINRENANESVRLLCPKEMQKEREFLAIIYGNRKLQRVGTHNLKSMNQLIGRIRLCRKSFQLIKKR